MRSFFVIIFDKISICFGRYDSILEEYARYLPFGLSIAASFLQILHSDGPTEFNSSAKEVIRMIFDNGGDVVDAELSSIIIDMHRLYEKLNLTLEKLE